VTEGDRSEGGEESSEGLGKREMHLFFAFIFAVNGSKSD
jgi:hypothetical protein